MEDPFKIGLKAFFGVATGVGILFLTFNLIQSIDYSINNFIENQEQKQREAYREAKKRREKFQRLYEQKKKEEARIDKLRSNEYCLKLLGFESEFLEECRKYPKEYWYKDK